MRVIYETTEDCKRCPFNHGRICMKLGKYLFDICFEQDCPLPHLNEVEQFTRYVTEDKSLKCHGNCKHWKRWDYNKHIKAEIGICTHTPFKKVCRADNAACEEYDEI